MNNPTSETYQSLQYAYDALNAELFNGELPRCLITMQRQKGMRGYFCGSRFANTSQADDITDEIALNPMHFSDRTNEQIVSTLAHEMCHVWQHHYGKPPRRAYHDKQWAKKMQEIGLTPTHNGQPGGKETGQNMTHLINQSGAFKRTYAKISERSETVLYHDRANDAADKAKKRSAKSKTKYTCKVCKTNCWAKPDTSIICGKCDIRFTADDDEQENDD